MEPKWYCFLLDGMNLRGNNDIEVSLYFQMKNIFGNDLVDVRLIGERVTEKKFEIFSESYFFVCCKNYSNYIDKINRCKIISLVLPNNYNPEEVNVVDINKFAYSVNIAYGNDRDLCVGDIVRIKSGYLENLYGIVIDIYNNEKCKVYFRFYTKKLYEKLYCNNLVIVGTIFNKLKFPIIAYNEKICIDCLSSNLDDCIIDKLSKKYMIRKPVIITNDFSNKMISNKIERSVRKNICENKIYRKLYRTFKE